MAPNVPAEPLNWMKSLSNSSKPSKPAAAMASSFWRSVPLSDTVAIERCMVSGGNGWSWADCRNALPGRQRLGRGARSMIDRMRSEYARNSGYT
jgi:hypothetical protein